MENRDKLAEYINRTLDVGRFNDYCPNGLQFAGKDEINHMVSGVTASERFLQAAIDDGADAVLVHHGYFWRGESQPITGMKRRRLGLLFEANVSLFAYHLPLDVHPQLGNNAQLAELLGFSVKGQVAAGGTDGLLFHGRLGTDSANLVTSTNNGEISCDELIRHVSDRLGRQVVAVGQHSRPITRVAWCSGGAQGFLQQAAELGADAFISGEISEQTTHEARENDILFIAAGHHATERYGVQALGELLSQQLQLTHRFIDVDNPA